MPITPAQKRRELLSLRVTNALILLDHSELDPSKPLATARELARDCRLAAEMQWEEGIDESPQAVAASYAAVLEQMAERFRRAAIQLAPRAARKAV